AKPVRPSSFDTALRRLSRRQNTAAPAGAAAEFNFAEGGKIRLLVATSDPALSSVVAKFEKRGYQVEQVASGEEAVAKCLSEHFDLALMEFQMPGLNALEAARRVRAGENGRCTPIIALVSSEMADAEAQARAAGINDIVALPLAGNELFEKTALWSYTTLEIGAENSDSPVQNLAVG
ncbi:MAG: response regulator, partial [Alphaproteobacteria bacterium]